MNTLLTCVTLFLKNHTYNMVEKILLDLFIKNQNWAYLLINSLKLYTQLVLIVSQVENFQSILKLSWLAFTSYKAFLKKKKNQNKKRFRTSLRVSFSTRFFKKIFCFVMFYYLTKFHSLVAFTSWDIWQYVYCNYLLTRLRRHRLWK